MTELNPRKVIDDHYDMVILKINNEFNDRLEDFTDKDLIPKISSDYLNEDSESDFNERRAKRKRTNQITALTSLKTKGQTFVKPMQRPKKMITTERPQKTQKTINRRRQTKTKTKRRTKMRLIMRKKRN
jgi:hypothetical protein